MGCSVRLSTGKQGSSWMKSVVSGTTRLMDLLDTLRYDIVFWYRIYIAHLVQELCIFTFFEYWRSNQSVYTAFLLTLVIIFHFKIIILLLLRRCSTKSFCLRSLVLGANLSVLLKQHVDGSYAKEYAKL